MEKRNVFISYKAEEINEANWIRSLLESHNISCWMAPDDIPPGEHYASVITDAISACDIFLLVLSKSAQDSVWIPKELGIATNKGKTIFPYMIEDCSLTEEFIFYLSTSQRFEAYRNKNEMVQQMLAEIKRVVDEKNKIVQPENDNIFTDGFKNKVATSVKKSFVNVFKLLKHFTPYCRVNNQRELISLHVLSAMFFLLFIYTFVGMGISSGNFVFSAGLAIPVVWVMWYIGWKICRSIAKSTSMPFIIVLSFIVGIILAFATLLVGFSIVQLLDTIGLLYRFY